MQRVVDRLLAALTLLAAFPLLLICAAAVKLTSPGPVIFRQARIGKDGIPFTLVKLRTMVNNNKGIHVTSNSDTRITGIGRLLRKFKIDELPQLWNVLRGDMSLVGPRPEVPEYFDVENPLWRRVIKVRPGITDPVTLWLRNEEELLAQAGPDAEKFYLGKLQPIKLKGYIEYLERRNWRTDMVILYRSLVVTIRPDKAPSPDLGGIYLKTLDVPSRPLKS